MEMPTSPYETLNTDAKLLSARNALCACSLAAHALIHNHCNQDRHLNRRDIFKQNRAAALAEWCQLAA